MGLNLRAWFCTLKPYCKASRAFTTLHSSNELVKEFVQLYRQSSLCWEMKHGDTIWHGIVQHSPSDDTNADPRFLPLTWLSVAESTLLPPLLLAWFSPMQQLQPLAESILLPPLLLFLAASAACH